MELLLGSRNRQALPCMLIYSAYHRAHVTRQLITQLIQKVQTTVVVYSPRFLSNVIGSVVPDSFFHDKDLPGVISAITTFQTAMTTSPHVPLSERRKLLFIATAKDVSDYKVLCDFVLHHRQLSIIICLIHVYDFPVEKSVLYSKLTVPPFLRTYSDTGVIVPTHYAKHSDEFKVNVNTITNNTHPEKIFPLRLHQSWIQMPGQTKTTK